MPSPVFMNSKKLIALASDLPFFEIASMLVRFNHVPRVIVNTDHSIMCRLRDRQDERSIETLQPCCPVTLQS